MLLEAGKHLETLPGLDDHLSRCLAVHRWITEEAPKLGYTLWITPAVEMEVYATDQVGLPFLVMNNIL